MTKAIKKRKFNINRYKIPAGKVLVLRSCNPDLTSHGGFQWPESGYVCAPDFEDIACCGKGLHGFLKGEGDGTLACFNADAKWLVCEVVEGTTICLSGKVKFKECEVIFCGDQKTASAIIQKFYPECKVVGGSATAGYRGTATAGYRGTATAGDSGSATAGDRGTATAGYNGTATAGDRGTATAGDSGTATAGYNGTATAGYRGIATAGYRGTATAGDSGTATAGDSGTATAGYNGVLILGFYDHENSVYRRKVAVVGENGIKPNVKYRLNDNAEFVEA